MDERHLFSHLQEQVYNTSDNYKIDYSNTQKKECCAIYFSSNAIFYPNKESVFRKAILEHDRYELRRMKITRADKHIFVRDIFKRWYLNGINSTYNTIDKVIQFLKSEVEGYKELIVCGISGGGMYRL